MKNKKIMVAMAVVTSILIASAFAQIYWRREITHDFTVVGIEALLVTPSYIGMRDLIEATDFDENGKIALTILKENFYDIWLNITTTTNADGLVVTITGQYFTAWSMMRVSAPPLPQWEPVGSSFPIIEGEWQVEKNNIMWTQIVESDVVNSAKAYCLVITFNLDTELIVTPGDYSLAATFEMGFIP